MFTHNNPIKKYTLLFLLVFPLWVSAQLPVQVTTQMIPPYSITLSDYATATSDRLVVNLVLGDVAELNRQVRLKLFIEGNGFSVQSTDIVAGAPPIYLDGGIPVRLTNVDLSAYFQLENLVGITPSQYSSPLPSGLYQFCFEVYDYLTGNLISKRSCATAYFVLNDPPLLNLPARNENVSFSNPQNVVFNWTPRHLNATNIQYEFTLTEIWDTAIDPQAAFLASPPLYQTTTAATTLLYGPAETSLLPDKRYGWRVRAVATDGINELSLFKNNGYSEIYYFQYTKQCAEPQFILAESNNYNTARVYWEGAEHLHYNVQYRKKHGNNSGWFEVSAYNENATIFRLEENTTYEYRVGGQCSLNGGYTYSRIFEFTTAVRGEDSEFNCGVTPEVNIANQNPLPQIGTNEQFTAGEFPVTVKEVNGNNGVFSGWGYIVVPYLANTRIRVEFTGIKINTDYQLTDGVLVTSYDPTWSGVDDIRDEIEALLSLGNAILEVLNLDINSTTKERIREIIEAILSQMQNEDLPDDIQQSIVDAANAIQEASNQYYEAQEAFENAETEEERAAAQEQMDAAEAQFNEAQNNLEEAYEEAEKFKKEVASLLKSAIAELYREGMSREDEYQEAYEQQLQVHNYGEELASGENMVVFEGTFIGTDYETVDTEFVSLERAFSIYLFAKMLNDADETLLNNFIELSKKMGVIYITIVKEGKDNNKDDDEIIQELMNTLKTTFVELLLQSNLTE